MGVISSLVATSMFDFVDYALAVVGLLFVYYLVKFFLYTSEEEDKALKTKQDATSAWLKSKSDESKTKKNTSTTNTLLTLLRRIR